MQNRESMGRCRIHITVLERVLLDRHSGASPMRRPGEGVMSVPPSFNNSYIQISGITCLPSELIFLNLSVQFSSVQFISVSQSCPTLWDPMNCSTPGLPVHNHLLEFTQTHVHRVGDAIQPSHPLLSPSLPSPNLSQYQSLFQ